MVSALDPGTCKPSTTLSLVGRQHVAPEPMIRPPLVVHHHQVLNVQAAGRGDLYTVGKRQVQPGDAEKQGVCVSTYVLYCTFGIYSSWEQQPYKKL